MNMDYFLLLLELVKAETIKYAFIVGIFLIILMIFKKWTKSNTIQKNAKRSKKLIAIESINTLKTIVVFGIGGCLTTYYIYTGLFELYLHHDKYSIYYSIGSFFLLVILQDAYFYWTHRMLHSRLLFKRFHAVHHKSKSPTVLTSYNFSSLEALILYGITPLYLCFLPLNIITFQCFLVYTLLKDIQAHSGIEVFPRWWMNSPLKFITTTTHHDLHHQNAGSNYGLHFTFWDRIMKTENKDYKKEFLKTKADHV